MSNHASTDGDGSRMVNDWNTEIVDEFRANEGAARGQFEGAPVLLLHTTGAKSGKERVNPMMHLRRNDKIYVFASKSGADSHPDWYYNLIANARSASSLAMRRLRRRPSR